MRHSSHRRERHVQKWSVLAAMLAGLSQAAATVDDVIPKPRQVTRLEGKITLDRGSPAISRPAENPPPWWIAVDQLVADLRKMGVPADGAASDQALPFVVGMPGSDAVIAKRFEETGAMPDPNWGAEGYRLKATPKGILLAGNGPAGCFYGLQTLRQMLDPVPGGKGATLECVDVCDWPAMKWRGTMYALDRPEQHARLAFYKMNLINWEVNDGPDYKTIPEFAGGMPMSHLRDAATSARRHFISMILETQSFGHVEWMLNKMPALRAMPENNFVIHPLHEPTYELLGRIYAELCPLYDTPLFHPGCDEAWGVETWCERNKLNTAEVVGKHIQRLADLLKKQGKRAMIWGDYILAYRDAIRWMNPKDYIICDWHYEPNREYPSVDFFVKNGFETIVSPSVVPAHPVFPDYRQQIPNIRNFLQDGYRRGAVGLLNTNWPVDAVPLESYWYGWVCGAEYAWNPTGRSQEEFNKVFFRKVYGLAAEPVLALFEKLARLDEMAPLERQAHSPKSRLVQRVRNGLSFVQPVEPAMCDARLREAAEAFARVSETVDPAMKGLFETCRAPLTRLQPVGDVLQTIDELSTAMIGGGRALVEGNSERMIRSAASVRTICDRGSALLNALPDKASYRDASTLLAALRRSVEGNSIDARQHIQAAFDVIGMKPTAAEKTVRLRPGTFFVSEQTSESALPLRHPRGWCHFPQHGVAARWSVQIGQAPPCRIFALLRHSAGQWANGEFVKGGRNGVYAGHYGWSLDGRPVKEQWIGEELNPDADEAFRWALLADQKLEPGEHVLAVKPSDVNHAIVAEFVFTLDPAFTPETRRKDVRLK